MMRKLSVAVLMPILMLAVWGCPKKKPAQPAEEIQMDTRTVEPPAPAEEMPSRPDPSAGDQREVDPLESADLQVVNAEARRQGFAPDIYFDLDKSELKPEAREALSRNADFLRRNAGLTLTIEGHCDERGTNEYNLALGERRAMTVIGYLTSLGVEGSRMKTLSYGEERPVCTASDESCWSQNRRAHLVITGRR